MRPIDFAMCVETDEKKAKQKNKKSVVTIPKGADYNGFKHHKFFLYGI